MAGDKISRVAVIGTGTIGASWTVVFLAHGLTVARATRRPAQKPFCMNLSARLGQALRDCRHSLPNRPGRR
jgi:3-hydroxyacyl-CoA dehydrogenase